MLGFAMQQTESEMPKPGQVASACNPSMAEGSEVQNQPGHKTLP